MSYILPLKYKKLIESNKPNALLYGGRLGGKTEGSGVLAVSFLMTYPYTDIIFSRSSYGSLADSSYAMLEEQLNKLPQNIREQFVLKKSPLRIERVNNSGTVYFIGYGGSNTSRTKSFKPSHPLSMVVMEETQELKQRENLDQAKASLQRHFSLERVKFIVMGNPPPQKSHWFNQFILECKQDADWDVIHLTWEDIAPLINDYDLKEILKTKYKRPEFYDWFYMGNPTGAFGSVYPMFDQENHIISLREFSFFLDNTSVRIAGVVIGIDGAVNRDCTSFVPMLILTNGQAVVAQIFKHDPKVNGSIGYHSLIQNQVIKWFNQLCKSYNLGTQEDLLKSPYAKTLPIWMRVDSAAADLVKECQFFFGSRCDVRAYTKETIPVMVGRVQSAISADMIYIIDFGGTYNYHTNTFETGVNSLVEQLDQLIWNEKQTGYDPIVPNDVCDAFTYGVNFWFANTENIQWFNILKMQSIHNTLICDIIKPQEVSNYG